MQRSGSRMRWLVAMGVAGAIALGSATAAFAAAPSAKLPAITLNASGATFPQAFYQEAIARFKTVQPNVTINYAGGGSGKGRQDFSDQVTDFGASDGLFAPADLQKIKGGNWSYIPTVSAPITMSYNLPSFKGKLKLTADLIAKIFQRDITKWNDPAIAAVNPGVTLPSTAITVAHRSDGSGTTENFTKYLAAAVPSVWRLGSGSTVSWPSETQGGNGNPGVANIVKTTEGGIGYVDFSDAKATALTYAMVKNPAGKFLSPSLSGTTAALTGVTLNEDLTYNPLNSPNAKAYPIAAPTWMLVYLNMKDKNKADALKAFLDYILTKGQTFAPQVDFAPLPANFTKAARDQVAKITATP